MLLTVMNNRASICVEYALQLFADVNLTDLPDAVAADMHCQSFTSSY